MTPAIELDNVSVSYTATWPQRAPGRLALGGVSLSIAPGSIYGLVGESGSGKSTLARTVLRLLRPESGTIRVDGADPYALKGQDLLAFRRSIQPIFQDSMAALDPRIRIGDSLRMVLDLHAVGPATGRRQAVQTLLEGVGLDLGLASRFPHQISGGQRQRVTIARALSISPRILVADEPVSALDLSVQAQILDLLSALCRDRGMTMLFISHDLGIVRRIADRVAVMHDGRIVEAGLVEDVFRSPRADYTRTLMTSIPRVDFARLSALREPSAPLHRSSGQGQRTADQGEPMASGD